MTHPNLYRALALTALGSVLALNGCGDKPAKSTPEAHGAAAEEFERGPHRGRMLRDGDFAVEMTIFEDSVEPEFHVYAYNKDKPVDPRRVQLSVTLTRLGGITNDFAFTVQEDYLRSNGIVVEPHSYDVKV